jgi:hypothetical protein
MSRNWRPGAPGRWKATGSSFAPFAESNFGSATVVIGASDSVAAAAPSGVEIRFAARAAGTSVVTGLTGSQFHRFHR